MGNTPYILLVAAILLFGALMPQKGPQRKYYLILMTTVHTCLCGLRYMFLTGDLQKYYGTFMRCGSLGWFSPELLADGKNFGFFLFNKLVYHLSGGNFQVLLFVIAAVVHLALMVLIYRYSPAPWFSYLIWNCMNFYLFGFSAIKQALAMGFVLLSFVGIAEGKSRWYLLMMAIAGAIHLPAFVFLPAYWLAKLTVKPNMVLVYALLGIVCFALKEPLVSFISRFYYEGEGNWVHSGGIGNRMIMILGFCLFGILFRGFRETMMQQLFHIMAVAAILQMFSGFDHIFTRLTDYWFQFSVLYIPMTFFSREQPETPCSGMDSLLPFNRRSMHLFAALTVAFVLWFYWTYGLNVTISYEVDNYLNYRSMWDVK